MNLHPFEKSIIDRKAPPLALFLTGWSLARGCIGSAPALAEWLRYTQHLSSEDRHRIEQGGLEAGHLQAASFCLIILGSL